MESVRMNLLAKVLPVENVFCNVETGSKKRIFEQASIHFENTLHIARSVVYDALFARERLGSTGLGQGVAIPHGHIKGLREAVGAFFRLREGIPFDAPDGQPVRLLFVLLVPEHASERHLQILSELARLFSDRALRERLLEIGDAAIHPLITEWQPHGAG